MLQSRRDAAPLALILSEPPTNPTLNLGSNLLPYRGLPTLRKAALHTGRSPAARVASPGHCRGTRCKRFHGQRRRSLDLKEPQVLPPARSILRRSCYQLIRLRKPHNRKPRCQGDRKSVVEGKSVDL